MSGLARREGYRQVLARPDFALLWAGQSLSNVGNAMMPVALAMLVLGRGGGAGGLGVVLGAQSVARLVGAVLAGGLGDRWRRTRIMIWADVVRVVAVAALAAGAGSLPTPPLIGFVFAIGVAEGVFLPAFDAVMPRVLPERSLQAGNALNRITTQVASLLGPALAGVLVAWTSPEATLWINEVTFVFSLVSLALIAEPRTVTGGARVLGVRDAVHQAARDFRDGIRAVASRPWVAASIGMATIIMTLVVPPAYVVLALVANERLGGPGAYGAVLAAVGFGSVVGLVCVGRLEPRRPGVVATAALFTIVGMLVSLAFLPLAGVMACWAVAGAGMGIYNLLWTTALQKDVPDELLGRVFALDELGSGAFRPLGYLLTGPVVALVGTHSVLLAGALTVAVVAPLPLLARGGPTFASPVVAEPALAGSSTDLTTIEEGRR
ncbi:MFS transporter [Phytohabitans rumicis]|uniref:MFS transporter n=1 Tax=Phytohabitans rumicis TaxID=1076125 RepID=A0A6V8LGB3_9ACTN|nr:MFS transporter [Phytohabitans rumicis]GFJ93639.1 MFS transporter [Phytohabitans rumicis]